MKGIRGHFFFLVNISLAGGRVNLADFMRNSGTLSPVLYFLKTACCKAHESDPSSLFSPQVRKSGRPSVMNTLCDILVLVTIIGQFAWRYKEIRIKDRNRSFQYFRVEIAGENFRSSKRSDFFLISLYDRPFFLKD